MAIKAKGFPLQREAFFAEVFVPTMNQAIYSAAYIAGNWIAGQERGARKTKCGEEGESALAKKYLSYYPYPACGTIGRFVLENAAMAVFRGRIY